MNDALRIYGHSAACHAAFNSAVWDILHISREARTHTEQKLLEDLVKAGAIHKDYIHRIGTSKETIRSVKRGTK